MSSFISHIVGQGIQIKGVLLTWWLIRLIMFVLLLGMGYSIFCFFRRGKPGFKKGIKEIEEALDEIEKIEDKEEEIDQMRSKFEAEKKKLEEKLNKDADEKEYEK
ncbi:MAG: hypothetical protein ABH919_00640 [bacterium]